jgi:hypothetical protein
MAEKLLTFHKYKQGTFPGNCGIRTIFRLAGKYIDDDAAADAYDRAKVEKKLAKIPLAMPKESYSIQSLFSSLHTNGKHVGYTRPYPISWAFADALMSVYSPSSAALILTDTKDGAGDGHKGSYATRTFAHWLLKNELYHGNRVDPIKRIGGADNYTRQMYVWTLEADNAKCKQAIQRYRNEMYDTLQKENENPDLLKQLEAIELEQKKMKDTMQERWLDSGFNFTRPDPVPDRHVRRAAQSRGRVRVTSAPIPTTQEQAVNREQDALRRAREVLDAEHGAIRPGQVFFQAMDEAVEWAPEEPAEWATDTEPAEQPEQPETPPDIIEFDEGEY